MNHLSEEQLMQKTMNTKQDALLNTSKQLLLEWMKYYEMRFDSDENQSNDDMIRYLHTFEHVTKGIGYEPTPWQARIYVQTQAYVEHQEFI